MSPKAILDLVASKKSPAPSGSLTPVLMSVSCYIKKEMAPVPIRSEMRMVLDRSNTGILGSNLGRGMNISPPFSVL